MVRRGKGDHEIRGLPSPGAGPLLMVESNPDIPANAVLKQAGLPKFF
jgi:hypothetical protein